MVYSKEVFEDAFEESKNRYKELQDVDIKLVFKNDLFFTMRGIIRLRSVFNKRRKYYINVNFNKRKKILSQLSEDDLIAWFGHEMAHIIDYESMSNIELLIFSLKYLFNKKFRFSVEKRINAFTANRGFAKELFGLWKKFCSMDDLDKKYKEYIIKNYKPAWKDVKQVAISQGISKELYE